MSPNEEAFLTFQDWIESHERQKDDWVEVAALYRDNSSDFATFSAMIPNTAEGIATILSNANWGIDFGHFGVPWFDEDWETKEVTYERGNIRERDSMHLEAFVIYRYFHGLFPERFDVLQEFTLYHNLYYDGQNYIDPVSDEMVINHLSEKRVHVKTYHVKDFLAARGAALVRHHAHTRRTAPYPQDNLPQHLYAKDKYRYYEIHIDSDKYFGKYDPRNLGASSRLVGKDIIYPFEEPKHKDYLELTKKEETFTEYVMGLDEEGREIYHPCDESRFLTPIFFKREVLRKYRDNPRLYSIEPLYLRCLDLWGIPYSINEEGLVHVWLGDLGRIPEDEQLHWKVHNVLPSGGLEETFFRSQILAEFVDLDAPHFKVLQLREEINRLFLGKFGWQLFRDLDEREAYIYQVIHPPLTNEPKELSDQLIYLSKVLQESLNVSEMSKAVVDKLKITDKEGKKIPPIEILRAFLTERLGDTHIVQDLCESLRTLQRFRTTMSAHRLDRKASQKMLTEMGFVGRISHVDVFNRLVQDINSSMDALIAIF